LFGFGCAPRGGSFADIAHRHFDVVPESSAGNPELVPKITLRNLGGSFHTAARNLHDDCATIPAAASRARVNGVDVYWAFGSATINTDNAILLVTANDGSPPGNATATSHGKNSAAYAVPGTGPRE
jgi:hypothetical protein